MFDWLFMSALTTVQWKDHFGGHCRSQWLCIIPPTTAFNTHVAYYRTYIVNYYSCFSLSLGQIKFNWFLFFALPVYLCTWCSKLPLLVCLSFLQLGCTVGNLKPNECSLHATEEFCLSILLQSAEREKMPPQKKVLSANMNNHSIFVLVISANKCYSMCLCKNNTMVAFCFWYFFMFLV